MADASKKTVAFGLSDRAPTRCHGHVMSASATYLASVEKSNTNG